MKTHTQSQVHQTLATKHGRNETAMQFRQRKLLDLLCSSIVQRSQHDINDKHARGKQLAI